MKHARMILKPQRITLWGLFGQQNLGNECTLQAVHYNLQRFLPDADISCICSVPEETSARHKIPAFPIAERYVKAGNPVARPGRGNRLTRLGGKILGRMVMEVREAVRALKILKSTDMLLVPGTGFLTDAATGPFGWPYEIFKWSWMARLCKCRLLYVSVGAGPIYHRLSRWFIRSALSLADFRSYRDNSSKEYLESIGFSREDDRVYPDLAFNLPERLLRRGGHDGRRKTVVGIGLMTYARQMSGGSPGSDTYREYLQKLLVFVKWLLAQEYDVRLLIGDVLYDQPVQKDFRELLRENVPASNGAGGRIIDEPIASVEHLLTQLAATDIVVATRFHNVLLALILGKPVVSIAFHHKCVSLMSDMGLSQYCQDIHSLDVEKLIEQFRDLVRRQPEVNSLIRRKTEEVRKALDEQYAFIFSEVGLGDAAGTAR